MTLIVEIWAAFQQSPLHLIVTVSLHPNQFLPSAIYPYVDRVQVMTYDMIMPPSQGGNYLHHAKFEETKEVIESFVERGCPQSKLALGIPAYGRHAYDPGQVMTYSEVVRAVKNVDELRSLRTRKEFNGYLFDSPVDVREKVKWAGERNLGGVFFWEAGQDNFFEANSDGRGLIQSAADEAGSVLAPVSTTDEKTQESREEL